MFLTLVILVLTVVVLTGVAVVTRLDFTGLLSNALTHLPLSQPLSQTGASNNAGSGAATVLDVAALSDFQLLFDTRILLRVTDYALWVAAGVIIGLIIRSIIRVAQGHSRPTRFSSAIVLSAIFAAAYVAIWHHYGWIPTLEPLLWASSHALTLAASLFWILRRWDREPPEPVDSRHDTTLLLESDDPREIEQRRVELAARLNESLEKDQSSRPLTPRLPKENDRVRVSGSPGRVESKHAADLPWLDNNPAGRTKRRARATATDHQRQQQRRKQRTPSAETAQQAQIGQPRITVGKVSSKQEANSAGGRTAQIPPRRTDRRQRSFIKPAAAEHAPGSVASGPAAPAPAPANHRVAPHGPNGKNPATTPAPANTVNPPRDPANVARPNGTHGTNGASPKPAPAQAPTKTAVRQIPSATQGAAVRPPHADGAPGKPTTPVVNGKVPTHAPKAKDEAQTQPPLQDNEGDTAHRIGVLDSPPLNLSKKPVEIDDLEPTGAAGSSNTADTGHNNFLNPTRAAAQAEPQANAASESPDSASTQVSDDAAATPKKTRTDRERGTSETQPAADSDLSSNDDSSNHFYELAWSELQSGKMHQALWAKAYSNADGEDAKARAWYIRYRVSQLEAQKLKNERARNGARQQAQAAPAQQAPRVAQQPDQSSQGRSYAYNEDNGETLNCKCCNHALMSTEISATGIATVACNSCGQFSDVYTVNHEPILVKAHPHLTQSGSCMFCSDIGDTDAKLSDGSEYHESCYERLLLEFDELVEDHGSDRRATATYRAALHRVYDHWPDFPPDWAIRRQGKVIENEHCHVCDGRNNLELIHKTSLQRGGSNLPNNLELICRACWEIRQANLSRAAAPADRPLGA